MSVPTIPSPGTMTPRMLPVVSSTTAAVVAMRIALPAKRPALHAAIGSQNPQLLRKDQARWMSAMNRKRRVNAANGNSSGSLISPLVSVVSSTMAVVVAMEIALRRNPNVSNVVPHRKQLNQHLNPLNRKRQSSNPNDVQHRNPNPSPDHVRQCRAVCVISQLLWEIAISGNSSGATMRLRVFAISSITADAVATRIVSRLRRIARHVA